MARVEFFPGPSTAPVSVLSPTRWAGATPESQLVLQELLQKNHDENHIFYNELRFHNHTSHHLLALWALGADKEILEAAYNNDAATRKPALRSPEAITVDNFYEHLGDENFFSAYLRFFSNAIQERGSKSVGTLLEEFIFSDRANYGLKTTATTGKHDHPEMLNRFLAGLLHAQIHVGYGTEFGLPGMVAEGLSLAAVHHVVPGFDIFFKPSFTPTEDTAIENVTSDLSALNVKSDANGAPGGVHALTILARIMKDSTMVIKEMDDREMFSFIHQKGNAIFEYTNAWTFNLSNPNEVEHKIEELQWMNVLIYTAAGLRKSKSGLEFRADFFFMHLVTSSLFLPSLTAHLCPSSQEALLRGYLAVSLAVYIARGRPILDLASLFELPADDDIFNFTGGETLNVPIHSLVSSSPSLSANPNPWLSIVQKAIVHPDDHLAKLQRAVSHYSMLYGLSRPAGSFDGRGIELPGVEKIDGTLFLKSAALTQTRLGRDRGGKDPAYYWDFEGFYAE